MKYPILVIVLVGMSCMFVTGCGNSELDSSITSKVTGEEKPLEELGDKKVVEPSQASLEKDRNEYVRIMEEKLNKLNADHTKLFNHAQQAGSGTELQIFLNKDLEVLTQQRQRLQQQIDELKVVKGVGWLELQTPINQAIEELAQLYEKALSRLPG